ncbi:MAG: tRNA dimethylallyltransferase [Patiriisocius sp.]|jgi:tRNA dimethylallyltransferase
MLPWQQTSQGRERYIFNDQREYKNNRLLTKSLPLSPPLPNATLPLMQKPKILTIAGPTASGKTSLSIKLAKQFSGEVISADSRQVYKQLDIGSGKVTTEEMQGIPHHLLDMVDPTAIYNADNFKNDATDALEGILARNSLPIIAGGTFFYVDTLLGRITAPPVAPNPALRAKLEENTTEELYNELREHDPRRAAEVDPQNRRRLIRAIEIIACIGSVPVIPTNEPYDVLTIGIITEKEALRVRFKQRAEAWLEMGYMGEIKNLLDSGLTRERLHEIGFEYILGLELYDQTITQEEFLQKFIEKNWQYAKKQIAWLKKDKSVQWFTKDQTEEINATVQSFLNN